MTDMGLFAGVQLYGWDSATSAWVKLLVNTAGKLIIDPSEILEDTPTDGQVAKAPTSNWAHDHAELPDVHHAAFTAADHTAIGNGAPHHAEAHTLTSHSTKAHSELTGVGSSDHHVRYADSEALAAAVQAGAITDGVTKAPTHDAVYDAFAALSGGGLGIFGDGNDSNVTISVNTSLTSDMFYNNLTVNAGITLNTAGYRIFVKGTLTNNGIIERTPNNGANATATALGIGGATLIAKSLGAGGGTRGDGGQQIIAGSSHGGGGGSGGGVVLIVAKAIINSSGIIRANGGNGGNGNGNGAAASTIEAIGGGAITNCLGGTGGTGGGGFYSGPGGTVAAPAATEAGYRTLPFAVILRLLSITTQISGGGNGGGGGRSSGGASNSGGGGGGGGGLLVLIYNSLTSGTEQAASGTGGNGYGTGTAGANGLAGTVIKIQN